MGDSKSRSGSVISLRLSITLGWVEGVRWLFGVKTFDVAQLNVHRVDGRVAIIKPECCVVAARRLVKWARRVAVGFER